MEVKNTKKPPLEMTDHFFTRIKVVSNTELTSEDIQSGKPFDYEFKNNVDTLISKEDDNRYQVRLGISAARKKGALKGYDIDIEVVGFFVPEDGFPEEKCNDMICVLGATLLYSAAREFIYSITLRGPWPAIYLPTTSFIPDESCKS